MEQVSGSFSNIINAIAWAIGETIIIYFGFPLLIGLIVAFVLRNVLGKKVGRFVSFIVYWIVVAYIFINGIEAFNYLITSYESRVVTL